MGFINGLFNAGKGIGKLGYNSAKGIGKVALGSTGLIGKSIEKEFGKKSGAVLGSVLTGAALGGIMADSDGQVSPSTGILKGGTIGLGLAAIPGMASVGTAAGIGAISLGTMGIGAVGQVGRMMVKTPPKNVKIGLDNVSEFKLSKLAGPMLVGSAFIKGMGESIKAFEHSRMGTNDGMLRTATPIIPMQQQQRKSYSFDDNAGATGDLVFALNDNR